MKVNFMKATILCLIAGLVMSGCKKDEPAGVSVSGVSLNETSKTMTEGETFVLTATVVPTDATNKTLEWTSSNTGIASVNKGTVTAVAAGEAIITVKAVESGKTATCTVTVSKAPVPVVEVRLSTTDTTLAPGKTFALTATVVPDDATNKTLVWSSSNAEIVSVDAGTVSAIAVGEATITVGTEDGGKTASCIVKVVEIPEITMTTTADTLGIGLAGSGTVTVDWGDGNSQNIALGSETEYYNHTYTASSGNRTITITGATVTKLDCSDNQLTALDVGKSLDLMELNCGFNGLTALDVSKNTALMELRCHNNRLTADALNALFETLLDNTIGEQSKAIDIYGNPGKTGCNESIVSQKGWEFIIQDNPGGGPGGNTDTPDTDGGDLAFLMRERTINCGVANSNLA